MTTTDQTRLSEALAAIEAAQTIDAIEAQRVAALGGQVGLVQAPGRGVIPGQVAVGRGGPGRIGAGALSGRGAGVGEGRLHPRAGGGRRHCGG